MLIKSNQTFPASLLSRPAVIPNPNYDASPFFLQERRLDYLCFRGDTLIVTVATDLGKKPLLGLLCF